MRATLSIGGQNFTCKKLKEEYNFTAGELENETETNQFFSNILFRRDLRKQIFNEETKWKKVEDCFKEIFLRKF